MGNTFETAKHMKKDMEVTLEKHAHSDAQLDINCMASSVLVSVEDKEFLKSIEPHLGRPGGKRNAILCILSGFAAAAVVLSI